LYNKVIQPAETGYAFACIQSTKTMRKNKIRAV